MCGIIGGVGYSKVKIKKGLETIKHRGPDAQQTFFDGKVGFGHARLSIIDLSDASNQPFTYKHYTIVFNGEIYNYQRLRTELLDNEFQTSGDTEVILHAYEKWGVKCLEKFNGMFAFCIYDKKKQEFFFARDRFGIKPFYYTHSPHFAFCSEINGLRVLNPSKELNPLALREFFQFRYTMGENTLLEGIKKLQPGHYGHYNLKTQEMKLHQWYYLKPHRTKMPYWKAKHKLTALMKRSIKRRMVSDVPVATFLSGGLDSSLISALAKKHNDDLNTFSIGFETTNELKYAQLVAQRINSKHNYFPTSQKELLTNINEMIYHMDEPIGDPGFLPIFFLSKKVCQYNKVVLSGDGADEIFGGYDRYKLIQYGHYLRHFALFKSKNQIISKLHSARNAKNEAEEYFIPSQLFEKEELVQLNIKPLDCIKYYKKGRNRIESAMLTDMHTVIPNDFFMKGDKMSSAFGLEQRVPFMDHEVVEFAFSLPTKYKLHFWKEKRILKDISAKYLPIRIQQRAKQGFNVPITVWFKENLKTELLSLLKKSKHSYYNKEYIKKLIRDFQHNHTNYKSQYVVAQKLWSIYIFEKWYQKL